jgi:hypothetical protein
VALPPLPHTSNLFPVRKDSSIRSAALRDLRIEIEKRLERLVRRNDCPI